MKIQILIASLAVSSLALAQTNQPVSSDSTQTVSEFTPIIPGRNKQINLGDTVAQRGNTAVTAVQSVANGEHLVPLRSNPVQAESARAFSMQRSAVASGDTITLPTNGSGFTDDFSYDSHRPDTILWNLDAVQPNTGNYTGVFVNRTWAIAPVDLGVCTFDGLNFDGEPYAPLSAVTASAPADFLTSRYFNLQSKTVADSVYIRFYWQAQGRGYAPNAQDSFLLQFNYPAIGNDWKTVWFKNGYTPSFSDTNFHVAIVKLDDPQYFANGFRFRFLNYASTCGSNDHWHLDNVRIMDESSVLDTLSGGIRYAYQPRTLLTDYSSMPWWHYNQSPLPVVNNQGLFLRSNVSQGTGIISSSYEIRNSSGVIIYSPPLPAAGTIYPYDSIGFYSDASASNVWNPPISAGFPGFSPMTGPDFFTTDYKFSAGTQGSDSIRAVQRFNNYYAYDDGTAEVGYGLYGVNSLLAYQFTLPSGVTDTLRAVQMYFMPVQDIDDLVQREFKLTVWGQGPGNEPGAIIYQESKKNPDYLFDTPNRFITYSIDSGSVVLTGTFYIGWQQLAIDRLYIGFDFNNNNADKIYYNNTGSWNTSIFDGSLMMRPLFRSTDDLSGVDEPSAQQEAQLFYPNPANDILQLRNYESGATYAVEAYDITGRVVLQTQISTSSLNVAELPSGVYFFRLQNLQTESMQSQRIVIAHN
jgi:Secretion system C-terminal sorting domain